MSKSPLTDEFFLGKIVTPSAHEVADFARELECKLNEATSKLSAVTNERDEQCRLKHNCIGELERLRERLTDVTKERDEARTDWNGLRDAVMGRDNHPCVNRSEAERMANVHREERDAAIARAEKAEALVVEIHQLIGEMLTGEPRNVLAGIESLMQQRDSLAAQVAELQKDKERMLNKLTKIRDTANFFVIRHPSLSLDAGWVEKHCSAAIDAARSAAGKEEGK